MQSNGHEVIVMDGSACGKISAMRHNLCSMAHLGLVKKPVHVQDHKRQSRTLMIHISSITAFIRPPGFFSHEL